MKSFLDFTEEVNKDGLGAYKLKRMRVDRLTPGEPRAHKSEVTIDHFKWMVKKNYPIDPIRVRKNGDIHDGHHRYYAHVESGKKTILAKHYET